MVIPCGAVTFNTPALPVFGVPGGRTDDERPSDLCATRQRDLAGIDRDIPGISAGQRNGLNGDRTGEIHDSAPVMLMSPPRTVAEHVGDDAGRRINDVDAGLSNIEN